MTLLPQFHLTPPLPPGSPSAGHLHTSLDVSIQHRSFRAALLFFNCFHHSHGSILWAHSWTTECSWRGSINRVACPQKCLEQPGLRAWLTLAGSLPRPPQYTFTPQPPSLNAFICSFVKRPCFQPIYPCPKGHEQSQGWSQRTALSVSAVSLPVLGAQPSLMLKKHPSCLTSFSYFSLLADSFPADFKYIQMF